MLSPGIQFPLVLLLFSTIFSHGSQVKLAHKGSECLVGNGTTVEGMKMAPLIDQEKVEKMLLVMNETRRRLGSFQICAPCTCCGARGYCLPSPCCYAINCNIPNRPFGFCSFTPRTCHCFGCHL